MVPINMAGMKKMWLNSLLVMSNVKVSACKTDGQSGGLNEHDSLHRSIRYSYD